MTLPSEPNEGLAPPDEMTPAQRAEAKRYGRQRMVASLANKALEFSLLVLFAVWLAWPLDRWLAGPIASPTLRLLALWGIIAAVSAVVGLPLDFYQGYVLEHRYGMSRQTGLRWAWRETKEFVLAVIFAGLLIVGLFWLIWTVGPWWWLATAAGFFLVTVVVGQVAPVLIVPLFYKVERLDNPELAGRMQRLTEGTGLAIQGVYRLGLSLDTTKANAMLAGLGRTRRVLLGDTLLDGFSADEIEVVFAHEVGHHVFRHIPKMIVFGLVSSLAGFWLTDRGLAAWFGDAWDPHQLPVAALPLVMTLLGIFSFVTSPLGNILSRRFERQCDTYALRRTGLRDAYRAAFRKLARLNKEDPDPNPVTVFLFHSHPPISQRLALADRV
jgi:STE24 endopeptidase